MKEIEKIEVLINDLPILDIKIGNNLLKDRNFSELQLLVDSAIIKIKHNIHSDSPKEEYKTINIESLETLSMLITSYRSQLIENISNDLDYENDIIAEDITSDFFEELY